MLKQALAKLRVAVDWFSDPDRIGREALGLRWLAELAPSGSTTPLVFEDPANHLLAMRAVPPPHENWKTMLLAGDVQTEHVAEFGRLLGTIHARSWERRADLAPLFDDRSFFESLRVEPYYLYTAERVPKAADFLHRLVADTRARRLALVHGDYSPKNVLVHAGRLVLLDHEVIHWGDPAFDLGFAMAHLLSKARHVPTYRERLPDMASLFFAAHTAALGAAPWAGGLEMHAVRHALGCLLARVAGRSPLEYLTPEQRRWQRERVVALMAAPPAEVTELVKSFVSE